MLIHLQHKLQQFSKKGKPQQRGLCGQGSKLQLKATRQSAKDREKRYDDRKLLT